MIKLAPLLRILLLILPFVSILLGCDETESLHSKSNYFPLENPSHWEYQWEYGCPDAAVICPPSPTIALWVGGDTVLQGKTYSKIEFEYGVLKLVRRNGNQYFIVNLSNGTESVFLDTAVPAGSFWSLSHDKFWEDKFIMLEPIQTMIVNGITYHDVLAIEHQILYDDGQFKFVTSTFHYYANGIGEILTYNPPSPDTYNPYGSKFSLLKSK
jgi:hypothetical protein